MKALHWNGSSLGLNLSYREPEPAPSMALVRVRLAGICATDLQILKGYMGFTGVPGHEFVGEVVDGHPELLGRRVVGEINFSCGECEYCSRKLGRHCPHRKVLGIHGADGAFAEILQIPAKNLIPVPDSLCDEEAAFTEPLAAAFEILEQVQFEEGERVLVLGDGKLGLLCSQVVHSTGADVQVIGRHESKMRLARALGIPAHSIDDAPFRPADVVVEATGSVTGLRTALEWVKPRGKIVLKSTLAEGHTLPLASLVVNEVTVIGSRCGPFQPALDGLARKSISVTPMIERVLPLDRGVEATEMANRKGAMKILLRCHQGS